MLLTYSLQRLQAQLNDVNSENFFLNICKVGEYFISFGTDFHIWQHLFDFALATSQDFCKLGLNLIPNFKENFSLHIFIKIGGIRRGPL